jgi:hypothetical protein
MRRLAGFPVLCLLFSGLAAAQTTAERSYVVDAASSDIHWLVYKAGAFARLGHNHVVSVGQLTGNVTVNLENPERSTFGIEFPVTELVVDDPALRRGLGEEFESVPTPDDIAGTRTNMLSERVLQGVQFPAIRITGIGPLGAGEQQTLQLKVELLGRSIDLTVPTKVAIDERQIEASGEFELNHADLGMQPFTVMMGALAVGEKLSFSYRVTAKR